MKKLLSMICCFLISTAALANESKIDLNEFAQQYFDIMIATQAPNATNLNGHSL
ncbi:MAG: hypothetical protein WBC60_08750 [Cognaticolwellia sp.]